MKKAFFALVLLTAPALAATPAAETAPAPAAISAGAVTPGAPKADPALAFWQQKFQQDEAKILDLRTQRAQMADQLLDQQLQIQELARTLQAAQKQIAELEAKAAPPAPDKK